MSSATVQTGLLGAAKPVETPPTINWARGAAKPSAPRIIINAVEGFGKTTIASHAPKPAIIMAKGETGYETLLSSGRAPDVPRLNVHDWESAMQAVRSITTMPDVETLVLDAMGGFERLCHEHVCATEYSGDWGEKGFTSFMRGYEVSLRPWAELLAALDQCHTKGITVIVLSHVAVKQFDPPGSAPFSRYVSDCHAKTWSLSHKWADAVLFGNFKTSLAKQGQKEKAQLHGGRERRLYTERSDAYDAKNRYGMPIEGIKLPDTYAEAWATLAAHIPYFAKKG